jgi:hypothetical protein
MDIKNKKENKVNINFIETINGVKKINNINLEKSIKLTIIEE